MKKSKQTQEDAEKVNRMEKRRDAKGKTPALVEKWFVGNHADIGGGWPLADGQKKLLSDVTLDWMLHEVQSIHPDDPDCALSFSAEALEEAKANGDPIGDDPELRPDDFAKLKKHNGNDWVRHDMLAFGQGTPMTGVLTWWLVGELH